ncbi:OmpA family protein [Maribacter sp. CXY002]|uniref:OmpA family protein n=1 Tax=Maribacter luteocoastalis TaxID=3407671 RepID=UPI003B682BD3
MNFRLLIVSLFLLPFAMLAQEKKSKGDNYFYGYQYKQAIQEYIKEQGKHRLTNSQLLNLADSYFKIGEFEKASELYMDVNKNDTIISVHRFNKLLQTLTKSSNRDRVQAFLRSKSPLLSQELLENAEFNYSLLDSANDLDEISISNLAVNTPLTDFSPAFYKEALLFSSSRPLKSKAIYEPSGESYLEIFEGAIAIDGDVKTATAFGKIPVSKFHKSTPYYAEEINRFFYILSNTEDGEMAFDDNGKNALAMGMLYDNGQFRFLLKDLSTSFYYPYYDSTSGRLYFAANFEDSYGGTDLYYVITNNGQIMSAPINLGPRINSPGNEIAPYIFNGSLYFSSDVFYGLGGMDVYKSNIIGSNAYSIPVNIGKGLNSEADDFGFIIRGSEKDGFEGYFASNRQGGKGKDDIYHYTLNKSPGLKTFAIKGKVVNPTTNSGIDRVQLRLIGKEGDILKSINTDIEGNYTMEIPWEPQITIEATKDRYSTFSDTYNEEGMEAAQKSAFIMELVLLDDLIAEEEGKTVIDIGKFFFDKNQSIVNAQVALELDKAVNAVKRFPELRLRIETHTDSRGGSESNKRLSQNRSDAIKTYLLKNGVSASNIIESIGYGEEKIKNNCTNGNYCLDFLHKQNERTLIEVVN